MDNLFEALRMVREDGEEIYLIDRDQAFQWYQQKRFPDHDANSPLGLEVILKLAELADYGAVWKEAWAGSHKVLAGAAGQKKVAYVAVAVWRIGRAHMGLEEFELATLYLDAASHLASPDRKPVLRNDIALDSCVLGKMMKNPDRCGTAMTQLAYKGSTAGGTDLPELGMLADRIQEQANRNSMYADKTGAWLPDAMRLSFAQYEVSLELNQKCGRKLPVGFILSNMADMQKRLNSKPRARELYLQSIDALTQCGQPDAVRVLRQRLAELG